MRAYANAVLAALHIVGIVFVMGTLESRGQEGDDGIVLPMAVLALFVLSAAVMGFLFAYEPVRLFVEGRKQEAVWFFWKTVATFAGFAALFVIAYIYTTGR